MLFSDRAIFVVVYSLRTEGILNWERLRRHIANVTIRSKDAPIILVGSHSDIPGGDWVSPLPDSFKELHPQVTRSMEECSLFDLLL